MYFQLDMSRMAFFLDAVFGNGDPSKSDLYRSALGSTFAQMPLYQIIEKSQQDMTGQNDAVSDDLLNRVIAHLVQAECQANWYFYLLSDLWWKKKVFLHI